MADDDTKSRRSTTPQRIVADLSTPDDRDRDQARALIASLQRAMDQLRA